MTLFGKQGDLLLVPTKKIDGKGTAYITQKTTFSDNNMVSPSPSNCAYKFSAGWKEGDTPIKLKDLQLNAKGININEEIYMKKFVILIISTIVLNVYSQQKFVDILNCIEPVDRLIDISKIKYVTGEKIDISQMCSDFENSDTFILLGTNGNYSIFAHLDYQLKFNHDFHDTDDDGECVGLPDRLHGSRSLLFVDRHTRRCFMLYYTVFYLGKDTKLTKIPGRDEYLLECVGFFSKNINRIQELDIHDLSKSKMSCELRIFGHILDPNKRGSFQRISVYYTKRKIKYTKTFYTSEIKSEFNPNINDLLYNDLLNMYKKYKRINNGIETVLMTGFVGEFPPKPVEKTRVLNSVSFKVKGWSKKSPPPPPE